MIRIKKTYKNKVPASTLVSDDSPRLDPLLLEKGIIRHMISHLCAHDDYGVYDYSEHEFYNKYQKTVSSSEFWCVLQLAYPDFFNYSPESSKIDLLEVPLDDGNPGVVMFGLNRVGTTLWLTASYENHTVGLASDEMSRNKNCIFSGKDGALRRALMVFYNILVFNPTTDLVEPPRY